MAAYRVNANTEPRYTKRKHSLKDVNLLLHSVSDIPLENGF